MVRFPAALALLARLVWRLYLLLPPRSRLRQAMVRHWIEISMEAVNRRDLEMGFALWHPLSETIWDPQMVALGFDPVTHGRAGRVEGHRRWMAEWGEVRIEPKELIDLGDSRLLMHVHVKGSGVSSGAAVDMDGAFLVTVSAGRVIHEQMFLDRDKALEAAGLSE